MFRVPVMTYLELAGDVPRADFKLQHQRVVDGEVLFSTDTEVSRLKMLLESHNSGVPMPFLDARGENSVWEAREHLLNLTRSGGDGWYSAQCPSCASQGRDNHQNNLQVALVGFKCVAGCTAKEVVTATQDMLEDAPEEIELQPGQTVLPIKEEGIEGARLLMQTEKKERYTRLDDRDGSMWLTVFRKNRETGETKEESHKVNKRYARILWVWLQRFDKGVVIPSKSIREYIAPFFGVSVDAWAGHAHRTEYFEGHYYPLLWLAHHRAIEYNHDGSVVRIADEVKQ